MAEAGELVALGLAGVAERVASVRFYARRLADDHPGDWDLTRAVDALDEAAEALVDGAFAMARAEAADHARLVLVACERAGLRQAGMDLAAVLLTDALDVLSGPDPDLYVLDELPPRPQGGSVGRGSRPRRRRRHSFP